MSLKKSSSLFALVLTFLLIQHAPAHAQAGYTLSKIWASGRVNVGYRNSSIPFSYTTENGKINGFSYEIAMKIVESVKAATKQPDLVVKMIPVNSKTRLNIVKGGTIDLECGSTTHNTARESQVSFSNTIFVSNLRMATRKDSGIKEFSDLNGKTVVTTAGATAEEALAKLKADKKINFELILQEDHAESFDALQGGKAAAFVMDDVLLAAKIAAAKNPADWVVTGKPLSSEAYACALRKDDQSFKGLVDGTIAKMMESGEFQKLYAKWFLSPIPPKGYNLNIPMSDALEKLTKRPDDHPFQ